ncbi:MFS transporter [Limobrevibacterium gyesilva]|uniref:MFS transporter n=1 Tax=Limobrevibacterium gyesilva TaxID=2991712 RepID=A0AA42CDU8_9PROT|nr:MFS transporter [Limobrevibacterium gyesilva]MCW3474394.1 MFS transporter [Limobrevibacterium gyesilva]
MAASAVGDQLFTVVLSWVAVGLLGTAAGYLSALQAAATLATALLAGHWADRIEHRRLMVAADLVRAAALLGLVATWMARGDPTVASLIGCVLVLAAGQALFRPALQAILPALVADTALLPATNALLDTTERIARLLGPGLVGVASAVLPLVHFVTLDAATFVVSAAAVLAILRLRPAATAPVHRASMLTGVLHGFTAVRRHPLLGFMLGVTCVINGAWYAAFFLGLPLMIEQAGVTGPGGAGLAAYGLVISGYGSTNLLATLVVGSRGIARRPAWMIFGGNLFLGTGIVALGLSGLLLPAAWMLPCFIASAALGAIGGPMHDVTMATLRQTVLARADMAAAVRAFMVMNQVGTLVALLAAPVVFDATGVPQAVMLCGAAILCVSAAGFLRHGHAVD